MSLLKPRAVAVCTHVAAPTEGAAETSPHLQHPTGRCCHQERTLQELRDRRLLLGATSVAAHPRKTSHPCNELRKRAQLIPPPTHGMTHLPFSPSVHTPIRHPQRKALFVRPCRSGISCGLVTAPPALIGVATAFPRVACTEPSTAWGFLKAQHISRSKGWR